MSSTQSSDNKHRRASSTHHEESTTIAIIPRITVVMSVASLSGFESLVDDTHDTILQFLGKRSYGSYGSINKRCREIFLSKNLPKETFFYGYAPLSMIKEKCIRYRGGVGQAIVAYNRNDILQLLVLEKNVWEIVGTFGSATEIGLDTFKRVKNDVGDDAFISMKINERWHVCNEAAYRGRIDVLKWLKSKGWFDPSRVYSDGMETVAKKGNIPVLKWLIENGCELEDYIFSHAAEGGHLNILEFLKERKCPLDPYRCMSRAAKGGSLESIQWLLRNGCSFDHVNKEVINEAAIEGHLHVIQFFIENGFSINEINDGASHKAAEFGHLHVLKWLHENNCPFDEGTFACAAWNGNIDNLQWLLKNNFPWDEQCYLYAAGSDNLEVLEWLKEKGCPKGDVDETAFKYATRNGNIDVLQWLFDNNFPWDKECYSDAARRGNVKILEWLKEKGCPKGDSVLDVADCGSEVNDWLRENGFTLKDEDDNSSYDY